jgi:hypothetical protein
MKKYFLFASIIAITLANSVNAARSYTPKNKSFKKYPKLGNHIRRIGEVRKEPKKKITKKLSFRGTFQKNGNVVEGYKNIILKTMKKLLQQDKLEYENLKMTIFWKDYILRSDFFNPNYAKFKDEYEISYNCSAFLPLDIRSTPKEELSYFIIKKRKDVDLKIDMNISCADIVICKNFPKRKKEEKKEYQMKLKTLRTKIRKKMQTKSLEEGLQNLKIN